MVATHHCHNILFHIHFILVLKHSGFTSILSFQFCSGSLLGLCTLIVTVLKITDANSDCIPSTVCNIPQISYLFVSPCSHSSNFETNSWESCWSLPANSVLNLPTVDLKSEGAIDLYWEDQSAFKTCGEFET